MISTAARGSRLPVPPPIVRHRGEVAYEPTWQSMRTFTDTRTPATPDEFWLLEHPPVFTLGRAARREHVLAPGDIPVVQVDRGGQVTYHGPGQLVVYTLVDLQRLGIGVRRLVQTLEAALIDTLDRHGVRAVTRAGAPGVYVGERKIAALGLRVRRGCSFHGLALNVDCPLEPFERIDPCGYRGLRVTRTRDEGIALDVEGLGGQLLDALFARLGYPEASAAEATRETA